MVRHLAWFAAVGLGAAWCAPPDRVPPGPTAGYLAACRWEDSLTVRVALPAALQEVSGIDVLPDGRILAHDDEHPVLYAVDPATGDIEAQYRMAGVGRGDFEAIAVAAHRVAVTTSQGLLLESPLPDGGALLPTRALPTALGRQCEIEGLGYEPEGDLLLIACKEPRIRALRRQVTIFRWSLADGALARPDRLVISMAAISPITGRREFRPSGLDRDPGTGHYLLVSSLDHALLEVTPAGDVVGSHPLPAHRHPQPEGIAVAPSGNLLIADEGRGKHPGTLTTYACGR